MSTDDKPKMTANTEPSTQDRTHKPPDPPHILHGWRLHVAISGLCTGLFFTTLETTIVATSLTAISAHFGSASQSTWIVTSYLVTYSSFLLLFAKLSDIFSQRNTVLAGLLAYALFSGLCAAARSMTQLIVFRALQGVAGSVVFSLVFVVTVSVCPAAWLGVYSGVGGAVLAVANVAGPLLGGALGDADWRWIFLINVPPAVVAAGLVGIALPGPKKAVVLGDLRRVDGVGAVLSVAGAVMLVYGLEVGGGMYAWGSGVVVGVLVAAVVCIMLFFGWEWWLGRRNRAGDGRKMGVVEALFPWQLLRNPVIVLLLLCGFFTGATFYTVIITLPRRAQLLYNLSATAAGVKLLALLLVSSFSSAVVGFVYSKNIRLVLPVLASSAALQFLGAGLLCTLKFSGDGGIDTSMYAYEVLLGLGIGCNIPTLLMACRLQLEQEERDGAAMMGALNMQRTMGGPIALAVCSAIGNEVLPRRLGEILSAEMVQELLKEPGSVLEKLDKAQAMLVRDEYNQVYRMEFAAVAGFAGLTFLCALLALTVGTIRQRHEKKVTEATTFGSQEAE